MSHLHTGREEVVVAGVGRVDGAVGEHCGGELELIHLKREFN